jgi:hypothetical protein
MCDGFEVRRARPAEMEDVFRTVRAGFSHGDHVFDFRSELPYLWRQERVADHWLCLKDGAIVGVIGVYPFGVRLAGVEFRSAGIGQVTTLAPMRGQGVMTTILKAATSQMDDLYDFTWLWGDRLRYGRFGWARGGVNYRFETSARYLPEPPPADEVHQLDPHEHMQRVYDFAMGQPYTVHFSPEEFLQLLGRPGTLLIGYRDAWVLHRPGEDRPNVWLADGPKHQIAALLSHLVHQAEEGGGGWRISFTTGPFECPLVRLARDCYLQMRVDTSASFRICDVAGYFEKAARIAQPGVAAGTDELSLRNTDNGLEVRIECVDGRFSVQDRAGEGAREMSTAAISEAVFGPLPLDLTMPGLAADSPIRALFQVPVHVSHLYAL